MSHSEQLTLDSDDVEKVINDEVWLDFCHEYEYSILFLLVVTLMGISFVFYATVLYKKRHYKLFYGCDVLNSLIFAAAAIKFCPKIWQSLTVHGHTLATQTGCKLMAYTETGMNHVVSYLVVVNVLYAWIGCRKADFRRLDSYIRQHIAWILLAIFAVEGVFGITPAIFIDVSIITFGPGDYESFCNSTQGAYISVEGYITGYIMLESILPYIVPSFFMIYPLLELSKIQKGISDDFDKAIVKNTIMQGVSYIAVNLPIAVMIIIVFAATNSGHLLDFHSLCVAEGTFRFFQEIWFIVMPVAIVLCDPELGQHFPVHKLLPFVKQKCCGSSARA